MQKQKSSIFSDDFELTHFQPRFFPTLTPGILSPCRECGAKRVKEPRHSEKKSQKKVYLYRSMGRSFDSRHTVSTYFRHIPPTRIQLPPPPRFHMGETDRKRHNSQCSPWEYTVYIFSHTIRTPGGVAPARYTITMLGLQGTSTEGVCVLGFYIIHLVGTSI